MRCSALVFNHARRSSSLRPSPPTSVCLDILLLPGASAVATQVERLSSNETNKVAQFPRLQVRSGAGRVVAYCIGRLLGSVMGDVDLPELCRPLHRISKRSMCRPTRPPNRGRLLRPGEMSEDYAQPLHRGTGGSMHTRKAHATREAPLRDRG